MTNKYDLIRTSAVKTLDPDYEGFNVGSLSIHNVINIIAEEPYAQDTGHWVTTIVIQAENYLGLKFNHKFDIFFNEEPSEWHAGSLFTVDAAGKG